MSDLIAKHHEVSQLASPMNKLCPKALGLWLKKLLLFGSLFLLELDPQHFYVEIKWLFSNHLPPFGIVLFYSLCVHALFNKNI